MPNIKNSSAQKTAVKYKKTHGFHDNLPLQILRIIPSYAGAGKGIEINIIRQRLESIGIKRSLRTIQRKIESMKNEYLDISEDKKSHTIQLRQELHGMRIGYMTVQESLLFALAYKQLGSMLPSSLKESLESLFNQAISNVENNNNYNQKMNAEWLSKIYAANPTQPLIPKESKPSILDAVSNSLYNNQYLKLSYINKIGEEREGEVMPLALVQQGSKTILVCRCSAWDEWNEIENKKDPIVKLPINWNLMLHRIQSAEVSLHKFNKPDDFNVQEYDRQGGFGIGCGKFIQLSFQMKRQHALSLLETPLSEHQNVFSEEKKLLSEENIREDHSEWLTFQVELADTFILDHWLRGFGEDVRNITKIDLP